ncbi:unnamed protein product [Lota lota]
MESAITKLVDVFKNYSGKDKKLGKKEFRKLIETELNHFITNADNKRAVDELMGKIDKNKDVKITFDEYFILVTLLATTKYNQM